MKKYIGLEEMSNVNCSSVLNVIRNCGEVSRRQITDITGLSWGGMTKIVNKLFEHGYIEEAKSEKVSGVKRTPNVIRVCRDKYFVIGLDINRVGFFAHVVNLAGEIVKEYMEERSFNNSEELLQAILDFTKILVDEFQEKKLMAIGVAMQGIVDTENGISIKFPHCLDWENVPIKEILENEFGITTFVEHDPNCMLYSSMHVEDSENMLLFRMDRSIGMAACVNGNILRGNGLLEVAHCIVVPQGKTCKCGQKGCLEAYVSPCIIKDGVDEQAINELVEPIAVFMSNMVRLFCSDTVILTGKLAKYHKVFEKELFKKFEQFCKEDRITIKFVDEAGLAVQGSTLIALQGAVEQLRI